MAFKFERFDLFSKLTTLSQWEKFIRFCDDGRLDIDNNRSEIAIKRFVIGQKA